MATYQAIAAVSAALRGLLADSAIPGVAPAEFQVVNADSLQSPMSDGVAILLYRVSLSTTSRNPAARGLAFDLHYLVAAWNADPIRQQLLLGWAARVFEDVPILTAEILNRHAPSPAVFQTGENVELSAEAVGAQDEAAVWSAVKALQQPAICYAARGVRIETRS